MTKDEFSKTVNRIFVGVLTYDICITDAILEVRDAWDHHPNVEVDPGLLQEALEELNACFWRSYCINQTTARRAASRVCAELAAIRNQLV